MNIEQQMLIADEVLEKLECADPAAILAGGAPRNWSFNMLANDLDFYIHVPQIQGCFERLRFKRLGLEVTRMDYDETKRGNYKMMPSLFRVYEGVYKDQPIQIMVMAERTFKSVVPFFGTSICKVWYKNGRSHTTPEFDLTRYTKKIFTAEGYLDTDYHVSKMKKYFPDFKLFGDVDKFVTGYARKYNIFPTINNVINHIQLNGYKE